MPRCYIPILCTPDVTLLYCPSYIYTSVIQYLCCSGIDSGLSACWCVIHDKSITFLLPRHFVRHDDCLLNAAILREILLIFFLAGLKTNVADKYLTIRVLTHTWWLRTYCSSLTMPLILYMSIMTIITLMITIPIPVPITTTTISM